MALQWSGGSKLDNNAIAKWQLRLAINGYHLSVALFNILLETLITNEKQDHSKAEWELWGRVNYLTKQVADLYILDQWVFGV